MKISDKARALIKSGKAKMIGSEVVIKEKLRISGKRTTVELTNDGHIKREYDIDPVWGDSVVERHYKGKRLCMIREFAHGGKLIVETRHEGPIKIMKSFHDNGQVHCRTPYKKGKRHGIEQEFNEDGTLYSYTPYVNGREHGIELRYEKGRLYQQLPWVRGKLHGTTKTFSKKGNIVEQSIYVNDNLQTIQDRKGREIWSASWTSR